MHIKGFKKTCITQVTYGLHAVNTQRKKIFSLEVNKKTGQNLHQWYRTKQN